MPIDPKSVKWDAPDPAAVQWDDAPAKDARPPAMRHMQNLVGGAVRGAGSIGATLLTPYDLIAGNTKSIGNPERRTAMDQGMQSLGVDTDSMMYGGGKLAGEVAGTMGVGGGLANVIGRVAPGVASRAAPALDALRTAGMSAGGVTGARGVALRAGAGGTVGGGAAAVVNPEDGAMGAGLGAALPGVLQVGGQVGRGIGQAYANTRAPGAAALARALDLNDPAAIAAIAQRLKSTPSLVPGSVPTVAQSLRTPQAGILERVVSDSAGGMALKDRFAAQNVARLAALERVAPTVPTGFRSAQQDMGEVLARNAMAGDAAAKARTRGLYESVPQDEAALYLPDLAPIRDQFFGRGSFTPRASVDNAVRTAQDIGTVQSGAIKATTDAASARPLTLAQAVRRAGGLSLDRAEGLAGELRGLRGDAKNLVFNNGGQSPDRIAQLMHEAGYIESADAKTLLVALKDDARMTPQFSNFDLPERQWAAARDAAMGPAPGAEAIPQKVTLREFDNLRKSIGSSARGASVDAERSTEAAALGKMRQAMDDRINEVVRGDGAIDENLPIAWADALDAARKSKVDQVQRFRTGPQAGIFRMGSDGQPAIQGGEVAAKFWGGRPGVADDVKSLKRLIGDNPTVLGQFRSMVTTEGASTQTQAGNLTGKFVKWVDGTLPGLKEAFEPEQVRALQRLAADIKRAEVAAGAGMSRGSNTYQNAQNALNLGLLDSPVLSGAVGRIPLVGTAANVGLGSFADSVRKGRAKQLAELLADSQAAGNALSRYSMPANALLSPGVEQFILRGAPVALSGRGQ